VFLLLRARPTADVLAPRQCAQAGSRLASPRATARLCARLGLEAAEHTGTIKNGRREPTALANSPPHAKRALRPHRSPSQIPPPSPIRILHPHPPIPSASTIPLHLHPSEGSPSDYAESLRRLARTIAWTEIAFPDLRLETPAAIGSETTALSIDGLVISFPMHIVGFTTRGKGSVAGASFFLEPAFPTHRAAARGLSGVRVFGLHDFGAVLEGGGIIATDAAGAFAGGGPAIGG
jgi:hypothetical protein